MHQPQCMEYRFNSSRVRGNIGGSTKVALQRWSLAHTVDTRILGGRSEGNVRAILALKAAGRKGLLGYQFMSGKI